MDHGGIAGIGLVVARGDSAKAFEAAEEVFDQMTHLYILKSQEMCWVRLAFGGMTARAPRSFKSARSVSLSNALSASRAAKAMSLSKGSTPALSCLWPGSSTNCSKLPRASTKATILVVRPPRDRPMA